MSLTGKLKHVIACHFKYDEDGKPVPGSAVDIEKDIGSPAVQKAFKSEFTFWTKVWLKKEQKALATAKTITAAPTPEIKPTP